MSLRAVYGFIAVVLLIGTVVVMLQPPIPQPLDYHNFADQRTLLGIPNFWNVMSNVPFLIAGIAGVIVVARGDYRGGLPSLRFAYGLFFVFIALVCFGSGYYHWRPTNATLAWDRLPMAVAFMIFVSIALSEHISERWGRLVLWPLIALGIFSVGYWHYTELMGRGDLRLYGLVQFASLALLLLLFLLVRSRLTGIGYLWAMFGGYALAKGLEYFDGLIYAATQFMSGHALKHVAAAAGMYCFVLALEKRRIKAD